MGLGRQRAGILGDLHNNPNITDLTGEYGDRNFVINRGDSRISMILPMDEETLKLNRTSRFLIDDYGSPNVLAYRLTKPFKLGGSYNENGVLSFVLTECNTESTDNLELHVANYYDYFPRDGEESITNTEPEESTDTDDTQERKKWM